LVILVVLIFFPATIWDFSVEPAVPYVFTILWVVDELIDAILYSNVGPQP